MEMEMSFSHGTDDAYERFIRRMNPPGVVIDNETCKNATVIRVDSANKHGILLEVVQILTDLNLIITKAYISSVGKWFMDVFHVTDQDGNKILDEGILDYITKSLGPESCFTSSMRSVGVRQSMDHTTIELTGSDRPGLLSEVSAVLRHLKCNVVSGELWTHNARAAAVMHMTDEETGTVITDLERLSRIKALLCNVLKGSNKSSLAKTVVSHSVTHTERRLHQMMFADRDYERTSDDVLDDRQRPNVDVVNWYDKDYSAVTIRCKDRPKLLFDTVCTLTDMDYVVFHAKIDTEGLDSYQEYYIRHIDGCPVKSDAERQRVTQCLEAAIERRVSEGLKLELCTTDRVGLLSDVTRIFRENSLTVTRAEVTTKSGKAVNTFYVRDASGCPVDAKTIDFIRQVIGQTILKVKGSREDLKSVPQESPTRFLFGSESKMRGKGVMRGLYQPNSCSSKKMLKGCKNVVLIDVDSDRYENVIIIDASESAEEYLQCSHGSEGGKRVPSPTVISIDDDDETDNMDDPEICVECSDMDSDASSSKSFLASDFMQKSAGLNDDECHFIKEKKSAFELSKCKKTYTGKTPCGKHFGLSLESEDSSFESDCSDCELMEGSVGKLREQWEKAFQRKKYNVSQSGLKDQANASGSLNDTPPGVEEENRTQQSAETPASSVSGDSDIQKQNSSTFETNSDNYSGGTCLNCGTESPFIESEKKVNNESFSPSRYGPAAEVQFSCVNANIMFGRETFMKDPPSRNGDQEFFRATSNCDPYPSDLQHGRMGSNGKENLQSREPLTSVPKLSEEKQVDDGVAPHDLVGTVFVEFPYAKNKLGGMPAVSSKNYCDKEKVVPGSSSYYDETQIKQSCTDAKQSSINPVVNSEKDDEWDTLHVQGVDATASGENSIIVDREKLKQTDEFKRAAEEEWASRQRELQIQAEKAQRLRKRKKAEMRLLDMERRQKQRLEEMRETQKKDEENMNLKDRIRIEVRNELIKLEKSCLDMATLLRSLGITVGGGFFPLSSEVHAAYKRALLSFHPDRASKTDIRQQVEAEEKFKLVSRMKEKLLVT